MKIMKFLSLWGVTTKAFMVVIKLQPTMNIAAICCHLKRMMKMKKKINIENKNYTNISQKFLPDSGINLLFLIHNYDYFIHKNI